jgi:hypothetical protein
MLHYKAVFLVFCVAVTNVKEINNERKRKRQRRNKLVNKERGGD